MLHHAAQARGQLCHRRLKRGSRHTHGVFQVLQVVQCVFTSHRFQAAHASGHTAFGHDFKEADITRTLHMGAAAQFAAGANV